MEHKITVEVTGNGGEDSGISSSTEQSSTSVLSAMKKSLGNSTTSAASSLKNFASSAVPIAIAAYAAKQTLDAGKQIITGTIGRLGTYTGNTFIDMNVNNFKTGFNLAKGFLTNPIGTGVDMFFANFDFKLQRYQQNLESGYKAYELNYERETIKL